MREDNMVNFTATREEAVTISEIVLRAKQLGFMGDPLDLAMDIEAVHSNGCPLDLARWKDDFPDFDFMHDINGISVHIDRETGELTDCFLPRCAKC
jgi:hypothetical protein